MGSFLLKGYGHQPRSGINYMQSSPRTTYLVSPQTSKEHMLEKSHLTLFQKRIPSLEDVHRSQLDSSCKKMNPTLLDPTIMADPTSLQTQRQCIENISFYKQRGRLFKGSTRFIRTHTTVLLHTLKKDC